MIRYVCPSARFFVGSLSFPVFLVSIADLTLTSGQKDFFTVRSGINLD